MVVSSAAVPSPIAVRYAWERNPACNLSNRDGPPASPFRSDRFVNFVTKDAGQSECEARTCCLCGHSGELVV